MKTITLGLDRTDTQKENNREKAQASETQFFFYLLTTRSFPLLYAAYCLVYIFLVIWRELHVLDLCATPLWRSYLFFYLLIFLGPGSHCGAQQLEIHFVSHGGLEFTEFYLLLPPFLGLKAGPSGLAPLCNFTNSSFSQSSVCVNIGCFQLAFPSSRE